MGFKKLSTGVLSTFVLVFIATVSVGISAALYKTTQNILDEELRSKLTSIVSTAAVQFSPEEIETLDNKEDVGTALYISTVQKLRKLRETNSNIWYAYILIRTDDVHTLKFSADADSLDPNAKIDLNHDGVIDQADQLNWPGEDYDVSEYPELQGPAFDYTTTDAEPVTDVWGTALSAYAPIQKDGKPFAVLGMDVQIDDYYDLIRRTFIPFVIFVSSLLLLLGIQTLVLVRVWGSQVRLLQELDRQKDELISLISHQLATPIAAIRNYLELLDDGSIGELTSEQRTHVQETFGITSQLNELVNMILDVSRIQLGRVKIDKGDLDLNAFFEEVQRVITLRATAKSQLLNWNVPKELPHAHLDKKYTRMIVENLLTNGIKYTPEKGSVSFNVVLKEGKIFIDVIDTGIGIPLADQKKIFGRMYRASNARNSIDGNGFGLFIVKGAAEAQGGSVSFVSQEGKGTTFSVVLPLE